MSLQTSRLFLKLPSFFKRHNLDPLSSDAANTLNPCFDRIGRSPDIQSLSKISTLYLPSRLIPKRKTASFDFRKLIQINESLAKSCLRNGKTESMKNRKSTLFVSCPVLKENPSSVFPFFIEEKICNKVRHAILPVAEKDGSFPCF